MQQQPCAPVSAQLEHEMKQLNEYNSLLLNPHLSRKKRGYINGIGNLARTLFGVLDEDFAKKYEQDIGNIQTDENYLLELIKNQTTIVEAENDIIKNNEFFMKQQLQSIHQYIERTTKNIEQIIYKVEIMSSMNDFNAASLTASLILVNLKRTQDMLLNTLTNLYSGHFDVHLFTPKQLVQQLHMITAKVAKGLSLPVKDNNIEENVKDIYELLYVRARITPKYLLLEIHIPLTSDDEYKVYRPIALPMNVESEHYTSIVLSTSYIAVYLKSNTYLTLEDRDLDHCIQTNEGRYVCNTLHPVTSLRSKHATCEAQVLNQQDNLRCYTKKQTCANNWIKLNKQNRWLYLCCNSCQARILCENRISRTKLTKVGILDLDEGCILQSEDTTLFAYNHYGNKLETDLDTPEITDTSLPFHDFTQFNLSKIQLPATTSSEERHKDVEAKLKQLKQNEKLPTHLSSHDIHQYSVLYLIVGGLLVVAIYHGVRRCQGRCCDTPTREPRQPCARGAPRAPEPQPQPQESIERCNAEKAAATNRVERSASKRWRGSMRRVVAAIIYNLSCFTHGCSTGWVSGVLGNEALTGGAWLAALPCLVALPAAPFFAVLADARGRKAGALCICISFIISWSLAAWCGPRGLWAARVAAGAGGAGALALAPLYCAEIAPRTRGLAAMPALACSSGILFAYGAGGIFSAHALSLSMAVPPCILLVALLWLPETPSFLISIGKIQEAAKVMCWFDGSDFQEDLTDVIEQQEVRIRTSEYCGRRDMRRQDSDTFQPMLKRVSGLESNSDKKIEESACWELFRHRRSRRALFSCFVLLCAAAGSGAGAVNSFAAAVLQHSYHAVPRLNLTAYNYTIYNGSAPRALFETSEAGSMLCGSALVLGAAVATFTVDKLGRKMLLLWSCSGIACCLAILGVYCDPRLRMYSWYSQRLWPHKRTTLKEKPIDENLNLTYKVSITEGTWTNMSEQITRLNFNDDGKNITFDDIGKPWYRVGVPGRLINESISRGVVTSKYGTDDDVDDDAKIWAPVVLLSMVLFLYNIGLGSVPYVLISELFSINVRSLASSLFISWMWLSNFFLLRYYGTLAFKIGLHGIYYISACVTFLGALYTFFWIPETKGKTQGQITEALDGPLLGRKERKSEDSR